MHILDCPRRQNNPSAELSLSISDTLCTERSTGDRPYWALPWYESSSAPVGRGLTGRPPPPDAQDRRCAPALGVATKLAGSAYPCRLYASATADTTSVANDASTSATTHPPNPPPVIRAPYAPWSSATATARSISATLT